MGPGSFSDEVQRYYAAELRRLEEGTASIEVLESVPPAVFALLVGSPDRLGHTLEVAKQANRDVKGAVTELLMWAVMAKAVEYLYNMHPDTMLLSTLKYAWAVLCAYVDSGTNAGGITLWIEDFIQVDGLEQLVVRALLGGQRIFSAARAKGVWSSPLDDQEQQLPQLIEALQSACSQARQAAMS